MKHKQKESHILGDYLTEYYDCLRDDSDPDIGLPSSSLSYIVSLLSNRFGKKFTYEEVAKLLKEEKIPKHISDVAAPGS